MLIIVLKILLILINIVMLFKVIKQMRYKKNSIFHWLILVFEIFFVFPVFLDVIIGYSNLSKYYGFYISQMDIATNLIYCVFVIIVPVIFYKESQKLCGTLNQEDSIIIKGLFENIRLNPLLTFMLSILAFAPIWLALLAPEPEKYFLDFSPFLYEKGTYAYIYHKRVMKIGLYASFFIS